ncbi:coiled-coil domain-containing protein 55-domain containing protein [Protomyces lactucae-debilis]|uniref:Coiled-coil domain-containing protein 55-domain containing protein n=1 Tax=Protomyces lactucae-debilis TaxID=2754530 RepID=A0A1Y2FBX6_PROLT|nr:coiled-coil domain-containing protein 55-domain containing protein [Protomyces lactucae-debilis]ORY81429.1 coiled-coil domain-containing protein 55-domain containing protein [Protomyces lactucae-debilis]
MLKTGLNIRKKQSESAQIPQKRPSAFCDDSDDDENAPAPPSRPPRTTLVPQSSLRKIAVLAEDDVAYDYDGVYDSMKVHEQEAAKTKEQDKRERKPKYMQDLFHMAEVRKRDRLQAEDVKLQREREQEGDMFADKEQFVTSAYRAQQEALLQKRRQEEEAEQALRRQAGGLTAFSAGVLAKDRQKHEAAVEASLHAERRAASNHAQASEGQRFSELEMAKKAEAELGHKVVVNDNNEIVDHRQLLAAGLNRSNKSDAVSTHQATERQHTTGSSLSSKEREQRRAQLERQERAVAAQLKEARRQDMEERSRKEALLQQQAKRTKTDADITSAKDRYLARKKAEAEAKAAGAS